MESSDIQNGIDIAGEQAVPYGAVRHSRGVSGSPVRKISRAQLEEETITVEELDCRLTSFIDKHFEIVDV